MCQEDLAECKVKGKETIDQLIAFKKMKKCHCSVGRRASNMETKIVGEIPRVSSEYPERDLVWSLRPIFLAMRIYGSDLDIIRRRTVYRRCAYLVLVIFLLSLFGYSQLNMFKNEKYLIQLHQTLDAASQSQEAFHTTKAKLIFGSYELITTLLMVTHLVTIQLNWGNLCEKLQQMDQRSCLKPDHYNQIRKFVVILMIVTILLVFNP